MPFLVNGSAIAYLFYLKRRDATAGASKIGDSFHVGPKNGCVQYLVSRLPGAFGYVPCGDTEIPPDGAVAEPAIRCCTSPIMVEVSVTEPNPVTPSATAQQEANQKFSS